MHYKDGILKNYFISLVIIIFKVIFWNYILIILYILKLLLLLVFKFYTL